MNEERYELDARVMALLAVPGHGFRYKRWESPDGNLALAKLLFHLSRVFHRAPFKPANTLTSFTMVSSTAPS